MEDDTDQRSTEKFVYEYRYSTVRQGIFGLSAGLALVVFLIVFTLAIIDKESFPIALAFIMLACTIFVPIIVWDGVRQIRKKGAFRFWATKDRIGQEVPFPDYGDSFEIDVASLVTIQHVTYLGDRDSKWVLECENQSRHELCGHYGNNVWQIFKVIERLRPDLKTQHVRHG